MGRVVPIRIPPGQYRNGTEYETQGRWRDTNLVRWDNGVLVPMGGWSGQTHNDGSEPDSIRGVYVRGAFSWQDNSANTWIAFGSNSGAYVIDEYNKLLYQIDTVSGAIDQSNPTTFPTQWVFFTFGEDLVCWDRATRVIQTWDLNTANDLAAVSGAPTTVTGGIVVTPERFLFALGPGGEPKRVEWCDRGDTTTWTAAATNQAGGFDLEGPGALRLGLPVRDGTLIVGTTDAWRATYIGYPDVYRFDRVGDCSCVSHMCGVVVGDRAFWMGERAFYVYDGGFVRELRCDIGDFLFQSDIKHSQSGKVQAFHNPPASEVFWLYESAAGVDVDSYVVYNYALDVWYSGDIPFTSGVWVPGGTTTYASGGYAAPYIAAFHTPESVTVTNGGFDTDSDWTKTGDWAIAAGVASGTTGQISQALSGLTAGKYYTIQYTISNRTTGNVQVDLGGTSTALSGANETQAVSIKASTATDTLAIQASGGFDGDIDDVYVYATPVCEMDPVLRSTTSSVSYAGDTPYAKTGPLELAPGERRVHVTRLLPDEQDQGELQFTFTSREYPTGSETTYTTVTAANPTDVRFSGRQFTMKVEPSASGVSDWRSGTHRLEVTPGGKR